MRPARDTFLSVAGLLTISMTLSFHFFWTSLTKYKYKSIIDDRTQTTQKWKQREAKKLSKTIGEKEKKGNVRFL